jgi:AcrR family transcriptional regulator
MATPEPLIKPPLQRRSQESLERVMNAGFEVLRDHGFDGFTLHEVSRRAGVSIGSIYSRVPSREALIMAIYERVMGWTDEQEAISRDAGRYDLGPRARIELLVSDMATQMLGHADVLRVFMRQAPLHPEILDRGSAKSKETAQAFAAAMLERREDIRHPDPELAVDMAWRIAYNEIARWVTHGPNFESARALDEPTMIRELARAVADYLLSTSS